MNQSKEERNYINDILQRPFVISFVEWVCSNFTYDGISLWKRNGNVGSGSWKTNVPGMSGLFYTKEQLIKQYLNENG